MNSAEAICLRSCRSVAFTLLFGGLAIAQQSQQPMQPTEAGVARVAQASASQTAAPQPPAPRNPTSQAAPVRHADGDDIKLPRTYQPDYPMHSTRLLGSTYIPMDSWMYPALWRLYGLGYLDSAFLGLRPWTRLSVLHMLERTGEAIANSGGVSSDEAESIYLALLAELAPDAATDGRPHAELDTVYTRLLGITDTPLRDSFHLGQSIINDYGRPYQAGLSNSSGASGRAEYGRFALYLRGEYQRAPSAGGYSAALGQTLSQLDFIPIATNPMQDTIPDGPISDINNFRLLEASASVHIVGHDFSFGKSDRWWGPGVGGAFAWSNNADNIYAFEINRAEPLRIPLLSRLTGPFRYDFSVGSLQGHTAPNAPWVHGEKISFKPTRDLEFGFERTVIWGGKGHEPITLHTFLRSFFSVQNTTEAIKYSNRDPGARFSAFDFSYRLPFVRNYLTLYTDSLAHDDILPVSAPRRAGIRPGLYLSQVPGLASMDVRVEAASTDPPTARSNGGQFLDYEAIQQQGTTNKGLLFGDAIGRENKGGQAWITYHLKPAESIQFSYRGVKAAKDFIAGGTTQNEYKGEIVKRVGDDLEVKASVQYEQWKVPLYVPGANSDVGITGQITWYPHQTRSLGK